MSLGVAAERPKGDRKAVLRSRARASCARMRARCTQLPVGARLDLLLLFVYTKVCCSVCR